MKSVKWCLLNLHIWITLFDYSVGIFTIPFILIPEFAGYPLGVLQYLGVSTLLQCLIVGGAFISMIISLLTIYENRFHLHCEFSLKVYWRKYRKIVLKVYYIFCISILLPVACFVPDQDEARFKIFRKIPCLPQYIYDTPVFVLAEDFTYDLSVAVGITATTCFAILFLVVYIIYNGIQQAKTHKISRKTFQMQMKFFIALLIQMNVPLVMFVIPLIYVFLALLTDYYNQKFTNLAFLFISMHGVVATFVMIMVHRPYRETLLGLFKRRNQEESRKISQQGLRYQNSSVAPIER